MEYHQVDCRGQPAVVEVNGEGTDVVIVGAAVPMAWSRPASVALASMGFRVTNFDYGPPEGWDGESVARTALDQVEDVVAVMDATGITSAHLIGLSRGGITAFGVAARHPLRVDDLVLAFPVAGFDDTIMIGDVGPEPIEGESDADFFDRVLRTAFSERFLTNRIQVARDLMMTPPGTVVRVDRSGEDRFGPDDVVTHPTFVIEGGEDQVVSEEHPARYVEAVAGARHLHVDGASHAWLMEQPDRFARLLKGLLTP